ncbi:ComEA family DNA-binding protein, partial [Marinitenerispora sediminis]
PTPPYAVTGPGPVAAEGGAEAGGGARSTAARPPGPVRPRRAAGPPPGYVEVDAEAPAVPWPRSWLARLLADDPERPRLGRAGVRALAVVCVAAALVTCWFLLRSRAEPESAPLPPEAVPSVAAGAAPTAPAAAPSTAAAPAGEIVVHVGGRVKRPGVVTLPAGSRVGDALDAAGGVEGVADTGLLNLARPLVDGEQVLVGVTPSPGDPAAAPAAGPGTGGTAAGVPLDLNTATVEQLDALPGIGPVLAERIVAHRTASGGFRTIEQLQDVTGIGERRFAELRDLVRIAGAAP